MPVQNQLTLHLSQKLGVPQQRAVARRRGFVLIEEVANQFMQRSAVVQIFALGAGIGLANDGEQVLGVAVQQVKQDGFLAAVVVIKPGLGRATRRSDVVHAGSHIAALRKTLGSHIQYRFALELVGGGFGAGHALL